jgi:hypothetical protein
MTRDPAASVLGEDPGRDLGGTLGGEPAGGGPGTGEDAEGLRAAARRQWTARRDLERRLHDGAALRLSALALQLGLLHHRHPAGGGEPGGQLAAAVEELQDGLHLVLQELRDVAGLLYPPLLDEAGLGPALREAVGRCPVPVRIDAPRERFGAAVEGVAYFALLGCLPAAVPDVGRRGLAPVLDPMIDIVIRRDGDALVLLVRGVDACHAGPIDDGVRLLGGSVTVGDPGGDLAPGPARTDPARTDPAQRDPAQIDPAAITVRIPCV